MTDLNFFLADRSGTPLFDISTPRADISDVPVNVIGPGPNYFRNIARVDSPQCSMRILMNSLTSAPNYDVAGFDMGSDKCYVLYGHPELGPGIFIYGSRRQAKLILTAEFMEYLRLPTPGTFRTLERTSKYVDQPMQNIVDNLLAEEQRCIAIVNEITSKIQGISGGGSGSEPDLVSLANSLQIIVDIAKMAKKVLATVGDDPTEMDTLISVTLGDIATATSDLDETAATAFIDDTAPELSGRAASVLAAAKSGLATLKSEFSHEAAVNAQYIRDAEEELRRPFAPRTKEYFDALTQRTGSTQLSLQIYLLSHWYVTAPAWIRTIEILWSSPSWRTPQYLVNYWHLVPFLFADPINRLDGYWGITANQNFGSVLRELAADLSPNDQWLFHLIYARQLWETGEGVAMYDPSGIGAAWTARLAYLRQTYSIESAHAFAALKDMHSSTFPTGDLSVFTDQQSLLDAQIAVEVRTYHLRYAASIYANVLKTTNHTVKSALGEYLWRLLYTLFEGVPLTAYDGVLFKFTIASETTAALTDADHCAASIFKTRPIAPSPDIRTRTLRAIDKLWRTIDELNAKRSLPWPGLRDYVQRYSGIIDVIDDPVRVAEILALRVLGSELMEYFCANSFEMPEERLLLTGPGCFGLIRAAISAAHESVVVTLMHRYPIITLAGRYFEGRPTLLNVPMSIHGLPTKPTQGGASEDSWTDYIAMAQASFKPSAAGSAYLDLHARAYRALYAAMYMGMPTTSPAVAEWLTMYRIIAFSPPTPEFRTILQEIENSQDNVRSGLQKYGRAAFTRVLPDVRTYFDQTFYRSVMADVLLDDKYLPLVIALSGTVEEVSCRPGIDDYPILAFPIGTVYMTYLCLVSELRWTQDGGTPVPNVLRALATVLDIAAKSIGTDPIYLTVRNFLDTMPVWRVLSGRSETNFKLAVEMVPTADNARRYAEDIAATSPHEIFSVSSYTYDPDATPPAAQAYAKFQLLALSYGLQSGDVLMVKYIERPMPWNGFMWSPPLRTRLTMIRGNGAVALCRTPYRTLGKPFKREVNVSPRLFGNAGCLLTAPGPVSIPPRTFATPMTSTGYLILPGSGSGTTLHQPPTDPTWYAGYVVYESVSTNETLVLRVASRPNGIGFISHAGGLIQLRQFTETQWVEVYVGTRLFAEGELSSIIIPITLSTPAVVTVLTRQSKMGTLIDVSDDLVGISGTREDVLAYSLPSTVTMPISTLRGSGRRLRLSDANGAIMPYGSAWTLHIAGIGITPGNIQTDGNDVIVDDHSALTGNVGYVIYTIIPQGEASFYVHQRVAYTEQLYPLQITTVTGSTTVSVTHANGIGPWTFFMDNASMGPSSMNTTSPPISAHPPLLFTAHGQSGTYDAIYRDPFDSRGMQVYAGPIDGVAVQIGTDGMVPETIAPEPQALVPYEDLSVGISMFHKDEIAAACYRLDSSYDGDEIWKIVRGQWDGESIVSFDGTRLRFSDRGACLLTHDGATEVLIGALSRLNDGIEMITANGYVTDLQYGGGTWTIPEESGISTFPSQLYEYLSVEVGGQELSSTLKRFVELRAPVSGGGMIAYDIPRGGALWFLLQLNNQDVGAYVASLFQADCGRVGSLVFTSQPNRDVSLLRLRLLTDGYYASWVPFVLKYGLSIPEREHLFAFDVVSAIEPLMRAGFNGISATDILRSAVSWGAVGVFNVALDYLPALSENPDALRQFVLDAAAGRILNMPIRDNVRTLHRPAPDEYACSGHLIPNTDVCYAAGGEIDFWVGNELQASVPSLFSLNSQTLRPSSCIPTAPPGNVPCFAPREIDIAYARDPSSNVAQFWFERAASLPYREWPQARCSVTINDSGRMPGITDTGYPSEVSTIEAFFSGWRSSAHGSSEWLIRQGAGQYEMFLHAPEEGPLKYPTSAIYRTLFGAASPWFSSYVQNGGHTLTDPATGDPIYDILASPLFPTVVDSYMNPTSMRPLDFLLAPGHVNDNDNDDGYAAMLNIANEVSAAPRIAKSRYSASDEDFDLATRCIWQLRASSIPTGSGGIAAMYPFSLNALLPYDVAGQNTRAPPLAMRISENPEIYSPILMDPVPLDTRTIDVPAYTATQLTVSSEGTCVFGILDAPDTVGLCIGNASLQAVMNTLCPPNNNYTDNRMYVVDMPTTDVPWVSNDMTIAMSINIAQWSSNNGYYGNSGWTATTAGEIWGTGDPRQIYIENANSADISTIVGWMRDIGEPAELDGTIRMYAGLSPHILTYMRGASSIVAGPVRMHGSPFWTQSITLNDETSDGGIPSTVFEVANDYQLGGIVARGNTSGSVSGTPPSGGCPYVINQAPNVNIVHTPAPSGDYRTITRSTRTGLTLITASASESGLVNIFDTRCSAPYSLDSAFATCPDDVTISVVEIPEQRASGPRVPSAFASLATTAPMGTLGDCTFKNEHRHGYWMETAEDLSAAEQFWTTYADLPIPGTYSTTDPEIPPSRWIVLGYDLYGVPDESSFEQRMPLSEVNLSHIGGPVVVGGDGQDELRTDVHIGAIRIKSRIAPISLWLKSNQTTMTSRIPVAGPLRIAYPPYVFSDAGLAPPISRDIDISDVYRSRVSQVLSPSKFYLRHGNFGYDRSSQDPCVSDIPKNVSDLTIRSSPFGAVGGSLVLTTDSDIRSNATSKIVYCLNRVKSYDKISGYLELDVPIEAAINIIKDGTITETTRTIRRIHITKVVSISSAANRHYGSVSGMSMRACGSSSGMKRVDVTDAPPQQNARDGPKLAVRPGCGIMTKVVQTNGQISVADVELEWDKEYVVLTDGSALRYGQFFHLSNAGGNSIIRLSALDAIYGSMSLGVCTRTWDPIPQIIRQHDGLYYVMLAPGICTALSGLAEPFPIIGMPKAFHTYVDAGAPDPALSMRVRTVVRKTARKACPYPVGEYAGPHIIMHGGQHFLAIPDFGNVPIEFDPNQGPSNTYGSGASPIRWDTDNFVYADGNPCIPPPAPLWREFPVSGDGLYRNPTTYHIYAVLDGEVLDITPRSMIVQWDPQETSIDDFDNNIVYEATTSVGPFVSGDYYTLSSIDYHFHTVTPAPETAVLSENEQYCVTQMRPARLFSDPRTAAACSRTLTVPLQMAGPLGDPTQHWTELLGPDCAYGHPYYALGTLRCLIPDVVMSSAAVKLSGHVRTTALPMPWDVKVIAAVQQCDYVTFRSLVHANKLDFKTRFLGPGRLVAYPQYVNGEWTCSAIDELREMGSSPAWTWIYTMISAVHLLACGMDDVERRKVELLQIFAEYCDICSVPVAEIAYFLSIAGCVAYPGDITRSLISVSAPDGFEISKYNPSIKSGNADVDLNEDLSNSLLSSMERIAMCMAIDMHDDISTEMPDLVPDATGWTSAVFSGNVIYDWNTISRGIINGDQPMLPITDIQGVPGVAIGSGSGGGSDIARDHEYGTGMGFIEDSDVCASMMEHRTIGKYMAKLLPRLAMRYAVGGIPSTSVNSDVVEYTYRWRSRSEAPWDFGWSSSAEGLVPFFIGARPCGYVGSSLYLAVPDDSVGVELSLDSDEMIMRSSDASTSLEIRDGKIILATSVNATESSSIGLGQIISVVDHHVTIQTPNGHRTVNLMSVVPKPDLQIYDPANIDNIVSARLHSKFVGFYCSDRRGPVCVWSPINLAPFAGVVPCLGSIRGPLCSGRDVQAGLAGYSTYLQTRDPETYVKLGSPSTIESQRTVF